MNLYELLYKKIEINRNQFMALGPLLAQNANNLDPKRDPGELADPAAAFGLLGNLISNLLGLALMAGAVAALVFFIIGGIKWGSAGSGTGAQEGRRTMLYAVIGLVMLGLVYIVIMLFNSVLPSA